MTKVENIINNNLCDKRKYMVIIKIKLKNNRTAEKYNTVLQNL